MMISPRSTLGAETLSALAASIPAHAQDNPSFELADNGVTVLCDAAEVGESGEVNGTVYTRRSAEDITADNAATTCTSGITDMNHLFWFENDFDEDIGNWDVSSVTNMAEMFAAADAFNQDIGGWDVSNVESLLGTFEEATAFNQDISGWDVSNVNRMDAPFLNAASFDQDLGAWDVSGVFEMEEMFNGSGLSTANYDALLIGWAARDLHPDVTLGAEGVSHSAAARSARQALIDEAGWTVNDAGLAEE